LVILFVWVYYAAQILFLGAEITQVYAMEFGSGIQPASDAVPLTDAARVEQGTRAPTDVNQEKIPEAQKQIPGAQPQIPHPGYVASPRRTYSTRGRFNPLQFIGGAIGVRLFGMIRDLLRGFGNFNSRRV
jgi:hypothetical protein